LLFFDAGGFADLINGALLVAHELSVTLELFREASCSAIVLFDLSVHQREDGPALAGGNIGPQLTSGSVCIILNRLLAKTSMASHRGPILRPLI
jgi:hypothetical protein